MRKGLKLLSLAAVLVASILVLAGCGKKGLVGQWTSEVGNYTYTFNEDGTGNYAYGDIKMEFTYTAEDGKLSILYTGNTSPFETEYTIGGNTLNVKDSFGNDTIYKRK